VGDAAIRQGGICDGDFDTGAENGRLRRPAEFLYVACDSLADRLADAGERGADAVESCALGFFRSVMRYALVVGVEDEPSNFLSGAHTFLTAVPIVQAV
jgi:hypothetical protein